MKIDFKVPFFPRLRAGIDMAITPKFRLQGSVSTLFSRYKALLLDYDGVLMKGGKLIYGAGESVRAAISRGKECYIISNATARSAADLSGEMRRVGLDFAEDRIFTAGSITLEYMKRFQGQGKRVLCFGFGHNEPALSQMGIEVVRENDAGPADIVLVGSITDKEVRKDLYEKALFAVKLGAQLITIGDNLCVPSAGAPRLGSAFLSRYLASVSPKETINTGKPGRFYFEHVFKSISVRRSQALIVGDDLEVEVAGGNGIGVDNLFVLTGTHTVHDMWAKKIFPSFIADSLALESVVQKKIYF